MNRIIAESNTTTVLLRTARTAGGIGHRYRVPRRASARVIVASVAASLLAATSQAQTVRYVNDDAPPGGDGLSWSTAYRDLNAALAAARPGDEIWVAVGTYRPAPAGGSRTAAFVPRAGVPMYGGFRGTETSLAQRAGFFEDTVLSGDLNGNNGGDDFANSADNSYNVVRVQSGGVVLDGFNIAFGNADGESGSDGYGAGLNILYGGSATVRNCLFIRNQSSGSSGGGAVFAWGEAAFADCEFVSNLARGTFGGGAIASLWTSVSVERCSFVRNVAEGSSGGGALGGGTFRVDDCSFLSNVAQGTASGGAIRTDGGTIASSTFEGNLSLGSSGGGAIGGDSNIIVSCRFYSNRAEETAAGGGAVRGGGLSLANCVFSGNVATGSGGGGAVSLCCSGPASVVNCTFVGNTAIGSSNAGGLNAFFPESLTLANCIFFQNSNANGQIQSAQYQPPWSGTATTAYLSIQGYAGGLVGPGISAMNPRFRAMTGSDRQLGTPDDGLDLRADSPLIDAGSAAFLPADLADLDSDGDTAEPLPLDVAGGPRRFDALMTGDTGPGPRPVVDIGAYESSPVVDCPSDFNHDGFVNSQDLFDFLAAFFSGC